MLAEQAMDNITYASSLALPHEPKASLWSQSLSTSLRRTRNNTKMHVSSPDFQEHSDLVYRMPADQAVANSTYARSLLLTQAPPLALLAQAQASPGHQWCRPQAGHYWSTHCATTPSLIP